MIFTLVWIRSYKIATETDVANVHGTIQSPKLAEGTQREPYPWYPNPEPVRCSQLPHARSRTLKTG